MVLGLSRLASFGGSSSASTRHSRGFSLLPFGSHSLRLTAPKISDIIFVFDLCQGNRWVFTHSLSELEINNSRHEFFDVISGLPVVHGLPISNLPVRHPEGPTDFFMPEPWATGLNLTCCASTRNNEQVTSEFSAVPCRVWVVPQRCHGFPTTYCMRFEGTMLVPGTSRAQTKVIVVLEGRPSLEDGDRWQLVKMCAQVVDPHGRRGSRGGGSQPVLRRSFTAGAVLFRQRQAQPS